MATDNSKRKIGTMPCEGQRCPSHERSVPVVVFVNKHETLSYSCDWCGRAPYAKKGTGQHEEWQGEITPFDSPKAPPAAAPVEEEQAAPPPPPAPAKSKKGAFSWVP